MKNNFKYGDHVKVVEGYGKAKAGMSGKVRKIFDDWVGVEFDVDIHGHDLGHRCKYGYGWNLPESCLAPDKKFEVGQVYKVGSIDDGRTGNIIKITEIDYDKHLPIGFKMIRGTQFTNCNFAENSAFENALILLTGKQIGAAIKAFDSKKPEASGVKEVKRKAKGGEYIKLTVKSFSFSRVGDILKMGEDGIHVLGKNHPRPAGFDKEEWTYLPGEYVVLEGYQPDSVREVKRHANDGEYIKLISADCVTLAKHKNGDVLKVTKQNGSHSVFVNGEITGCVGDSEYVVLENYNPESLTGTICIGGKHVYSCAEVEEAKKLCKEMLSELFDSRQSCVLYVLPKDRIEVKLTFGYPCGKEIAVAKCSQNDEYNEWIGKCVALCKVLHKPIPAFIVGGEKSKHFSLDKARKLSYQRGKSDIDIHCANEEQVKELSKALEALGYCWNSGDSLTAISYSDNETYRLYDDMGVSHCQGKYHSPVEFSDCFVED